jgi:hypothetical protein
VVGLGVLGTLTVTVADCMLMNFILCAEQ